MYKAKDSGRNHFHFFTPALERLAAAPLVAETRLRQAVKNEQFQLYYQPITALGTGKLLGLRPRCAGIPKIWALLALIFSFQWPKLLA